MKLSEIKNMLKNDDTIEVDGYKFRVNPATGEIYVEKENPPFMPVYVFIGSAGIKTAEKIIADYCERV